MSEKLTPEQINAITQAVEAHVKATGQNVNTQQLIPELTALLNQIPTFLTNLIGGTGGAAVNTLLSLLTGLTGILTSTTGSIAGSNLAPQLVNIIQKQLPQQQEQQK